MLISETPAVVIIGPSKHGLDAPIASTVEVPVQRAAKVCFRRRPCTDHSQSGCVVVVPYWEYEAVCRALNRWCAVLPASLKSFPLGKNDGCGAWQTSYLPLPPQEAEFE